MIEMKPFSFRWYVNVIIQCTAKDIDYQNKTPFLYHKKTFDDYKRYAILLEYITERFYKKFEK